MQYPCKGYIIINWDKNVPDFKNKNCVKYMFTEITILWKY